MTNKETHMKAEELQQKIAGYRASFWLPRGVVRKVILFTLLAFAVKFFIRDSYFAMFITLLFAATFSPRCVGEAASFLGRTSGKIQRMFE